MRTREEIEKDIKTPPLSIAEKLQLEVSLDIRDILSRIEKAQPSGEY